MPFSSRFLLGSLYLYLRFRVLGVQCFRNSGVFFRRLLFCNKRKTTIGQILGLLFPARWKSVLIESSSEWHCIFRCFFFAMSANSVSIGLSSTRFKVQNLPNRPRNHNFCKELFGVFGIYRFRRLFYRRLRFGDYRWISKTWNPIYNDSNFT